MAEGDDVEKALRSLQQMLKHHDYSKAGPVIASAKAQLLRARVLIPSLQLQRSKPRAVQLAQEITECGALIAIRRKDAEGFLRYVSQLQEFYNINATLRESGELKEDSRTNESKITGLYLLLLLIQRDNAGYHMALEKLEMAEDGKIYRGDDPFINYPVKMEQWLSEGVYDKVWKATTGHDIPSEEFSLFTDVSDPLSYTNRDLSLGNSRLGT